MSQLAKAITRRRRTIRRTVPSDLTKFTPDVTAYQPPQ